jgi:hypothetical protein
VLSFTAYICNCVIIYRLYLELCYHLPPIFVIVLSFTTYICNCVIIYRLYLELCYHLPPIFVIVLSFTAYICNCVIIYRLYLELVWCGWWCLMPLSTIFQLVISWLSVLLVEETAVPGENHRPVESHYKLYDIMMDRVHRVMSRVRTQNCSQPIINLWCITGDSVNITQSL